MATHKGECFAGLLRSRSRGNLRHGLLSLPIMPFVVRWTCQCFYPLEA